MTSNADRTALAIERLKLWADALTSLAEPRRAATLVKVLEQGDHEGLQSLLYDTKLPQNGGCMDIGETLFRVVNFSRGHFEERFEVVSRIFEFGPPSETEGRVYQLPDGTFVFVSERQWADYAARAADDPAWAEQNKALLKTIGVLRPYWVWVPDGKLVKVPPKHVCFPGPVTNPIERVAGAAPVNA